MGSACRRAQIDADQNPNEQNQMSGRDSGRRPTTRSPSKGKDIKKQQTLIDTAPTIARTSRIQYKNIHEQYEFDKKVLGTGFSGPVKLAVDKQTGRKVAVKPFIKAGAKRDRVILLKNEAEIYLSIDHPNIAKLLEIYEDDEAVYLVMEYCSGRELYSRLVEKKQYTEYIAAETTKQMLDALAYLHSHNIVHRDLKLENWLYESEGEDAPLKLIDFGFSKVWNPTMSRKMHLTCGSIHYVSPDTLSRSYTNKCDLWSLGVLVYMLLVGYQPFWGANDDELIEKICRGEYSLESLR
uniref:non-specific serine/threonine protein kinase n=1 Tax=Chromera velia CCMP2878 TaxID=1169474 RepID=A0A0G4HV92_9ALVE|eukprot:Cvel_32080.t1-p1 / transcript=Cvel_32080.t1 / gene=Cvel_32080 / organism=Chromera_velia_CCMP2878 / gene_product=Calcium-dependent protein kinase 2, putative / transcript_product=Calcium-dependent protein kinase 2, putative / location=Cvel_scaffold4905:58-1561(-) / protein_length=294 / sequence_SO=supercontig / SO=protein_coding / is_pseudo=false